jgi:hypothetical protein
MWDSKKGEFVSSFQGQGYLGVCLLWGANKIRSVIVNVYAPCLLQSKKALWVDLLVAMRAYPAEHYCILGDFNSIRCNGERRGASGGDSREDTRLFNVFVENSGLNDLPLMGRRYTWVQPNKRCMSRLDRVLVSSNWLDEWGEVSLWGLKRDVSDHCPLLLKYNGYGWGPKPFRFNNHWVNNNTFKKVVEEAWASYEVNGWMGYVMKEKMKLLKGALRKWNKEVYGCMESKIENLTEAIEVLELKGERDGLSELELVERKNKFNHLWLLLKSKEGVEFQKSRSRWLREGDANTSFFHACVKSRKRSNSIIALKKGREWLSKPIEIRAEVVDYFKKHFEEVSWDRPRLDGVDFKQLSSGDVGELEVDFVEREVAEVIELSDGNKSPGPDGFNFTFFKKFWEVTKREIMRLFHEFSTPENYHQVLLLTLLP